MTLTPGRASLNPPTSATGRRRSTTAEPNSDGVLAVQDRARDVFLGDAEKTRRQRRAVERRAQLDRGRQHEENEEGRSRILLSHRRRKADRGNRRGDRGIPQGPDRWNRPLRPGCRKGRARCAKARDACRREGQSETEGHGARQIFAAFGSAGYRRGMENRQRDGRTEIGLHCWRWYSTVPSSCVTL